MKKQSLHFLGWTGWIPVCLIAAAGITLVACSNDDDPAAVAPEPFTTTLTFSSAEKDTTLVFEAYGDWKASVTKSDVAGIESAKTGKQGKVEMKVRIFENKTFASRDAEIRINDGRTSANIYKITQNPALRAINFSKTLNFTQADTVFTDTVTVISNAAWEITSMPAWVKSWKKTDPQLSPEEGVQTSIELVFIADHSKLTPAKMEGQIQFKDQTEAQYPLNVEFAGFTPYVQFDVTELTLEEEEENSGIYKGKVIVSSNVNWTIDNQDAAFVGDVDNVTNFLGNALETKNTVWVTMDQTKLSTDEQVGTLHFKDQLTNTDVPLSVRFVGTGAGYINFEREKIFDRSFDAKLTDDMGEPLPDALGSVDFTVFAAEPVDFIIIKYDNGFPWHEEVTWAGVDPVEPVTRAPIKSGTYQLWVQQRWAGMPEVDQERVAMLFVVPQGITIDDLFVGDSDDLKPEWEGKGTHFKQKGLAIEYYMTLGDITEGSTVDAPKAGLNKLLEMDTDCENWTVYVDDEALNPQKHWLSVDYSEGGWHLVVKTNDTGVSRKSNVSFRAWRGESVEEQVLISFWVSQGK